MSQSANTYSQKPLDRFRGKKWFDVFENYFWLPLIWRNKLQKIIEIFDLLISSIYEFRFAWKSRSLVLKQMIAVGVSSIPLVFVTSVFSGMVAAVQAKYQFRNFVPDKFVGTAATKMIIIELGPVLTGLVLAGRVGSALAAEIGTMKEKEELHAMETLDLNPYRYLAMPRLIAFMTMMPCLTIFSMFLAIVGAWFVSVVALDVTSYTFVEGSKYFFQIKDLFAGILKSFVFGIAIFLMGYYNGAKAGNGAKGVGKATMNVVVSSCVLILIFDFLIALLVF